MQKVNATNEGKILTKKQEWAENCNDFFELEGEARMTFKQYIGVAFAAFILITAIIITFKACVLLHDYIIG